MNFLRFWRQFLIDFFFVAAGVGSILGFYVSVEDHYRWGIYGSFAIIVLTSVCFCGRCFASQESMRVEAAVDKQRREAAEAMLAALPSRTVDALTSYVREGAYAVWFRDMVLRLRRQARRAGLAEIDASGFSVRSVQYSPPDLYVIATCTEAQRYHFQVNDVFLLTTTNAKGVRVSIAQLVVSQPVNDQLTVVMRIESTMDERAIQALSHMAITDKITAGSLDAYRIEIPDRLTASSTALETAANVIELLRRRRG